jgi:NADPH:quinone reductase
VTASAGPGELLVRVRAAGLNRADYLRWIAAGSAPGSELAGEVVNVGPEVRGWSVGDRVMSRGPGFLAEPVAVPAEVAMPVPDSFSWEEAGALPIALMTMHDAVATHGQLAPGDTVLVHAATSGVGVAAVQLAALLGASVVYVTSRSTRKLDVLRQYLGQLPCQLVGIETTSTAFESVAIDVNLIIDNVGASVLAGNLAAAAITGRIVQVGRLGGQTAEINLDELARKRIEIIGVTFRTRTEEEIAQIVRRALVGVGDRLDRVRPRIERTYPLSDVNTALEDLATDKHVGKLVVVAPR